MKPRLDPKETFVLYGVILGFLFIFYVIGLFVGKNRFVEARAEGDPPPLGETPLPDLKPQLDFYQRLMVPESGIRETPALPASEYTVQVGAFGEQQEAREILLRLQTKGYSARLRAPSPQDRYFRVWVGGFATEQQAKRMEEELRKDGFLTYVKKIQPVDGVP